MLGRRTVLGGLAGAMAGLAAGRGAFGAPLSFGAKRKPPRLRLGDTVGLVEPASFTDGPADLEAVSRTIEGMGLVPKFAPHVGDRYGYLAGTDRQRADDLTAMYADPGVRAVFAVRGGWGCARILPLLDWKVIRANPKLLVGFSDITALHLAFAARAQFPTIHAPNAANSWLKTSWESFWRLAFDGETPLLGAPDRGDATLPQLPPVTTIRGGTARGRLLGGNLSVLTALVGTPWLPDFEGAILFLEDVGEAEYRIDRMLSQLALSGILGKVAGVIFGQCVRCTEGIASYIGFTVPQLLDQYLSPLGVPAFSGADIGHVRNQLSLPEGVRVEIDASAGTIRVLEPATA